MGLTEKLATNVLTRSWPGDFPLEHLYTTGVAGERFFREIKDNARLMGTRCPECGLVYLPARLYCERCLSGLDEWVLLPSVGTLFSYTILHRDVDGQPLAEPVVVGFVDIPGAHGGLIHRIGEVHPSQVRIDMPVEAVFLPPEERVGSILDIRHFRPRQP